MKRFTINIQEELKKRLDEMSDINWSEIAKKGIIKKLEQLEKFEKFSNKGAS